MSFSYSISILCFRPGITKQYQIIGIYKLSQNTFSNTLCFLAQYHSEQKGVETLVDCNIYMKPFQTFILQSHDCFNFILSYIFLNLFHLCFYHAFSF